MCQIPWGTHNILHCIHQETICECTLLFKSFGIIIWLQLPFVWCDYEFWISHWTLNILSSWFSFGYLQSFQRVDWTGCVKLWFFSTWHIKQFLFKSDQNLKLNFQFLLPVTGKYIEYEMLILLKFCSEVSLSLSVVWLNSVQC